MGSQGDLRWLKEAKRGEGCRQTGGQFDFDAMRCDGCDGCSDAGVCHLHGEDKG
jgi:hypothetical protein